MLWKQNCAMCILISHAHHTADKCWTAEQVKINKNGSCKHVNSSCRDGDHIFYKTRNVIHVCRSTLVVERLV